VKGYSSTAQSCSRAGCIICRSDFATRNKDGCESSSPKVPSVKMAHDLPLLLPLTCAHWNVTSTSSSSAPTLICPPPHIIFIRPPMKVANSNADEAPGSMGRSSSPCFVSFLVVLALAWEVELLCAEPPVLDICCVSLL